MKKLAIFAAAFVLTLGLAQCKKEQPNAQITEGETVHITVNVGASTGSATNGSRAGITDPSNSGRYTFNQDDKLYVGYNGACVGTLDYSASTSKFSGDITISQSGSQRLHFYYLGGSLTPTVNGSQYTVDISNQSSNYPVISYGISNRDYDGAGAYTTTLYNKCGLVKFNLAEDTDAEVKVGGLYTKATIDFTDPGVVTPSDEGDITLHSGASNTERWAILLPQENISATATISGYDCSIASFTDVVDNCYFYDDDHHAVSITMTAAPTVPEGAINGLFTVASGKQVWFSQGNLQYIGSASMPYWKFADNQWDYLGTTTGQNSDSQTANRDLFGWGTSGYNHGANAYHPWSTSSINNDYYAYGQATYNLYDDDGQADWGYNAISNGGNAENSGWRTLTRDEWVYVINSRNTTSGIRYAKATVNNVNGVVLLPNSWDAKVYTLNNTNSSDADFTSNTITAADWTNVLEASGAVFLPAAGYRAGTYVSNVGSNGYYWSASSVQSYSKRYLYFGSGNLAVQGSYPYNGQSVRLVRNAE